MTSVSFSKPSLLVQILFSIAATVSVNAQSAFSSLGYTVEQPLTGQPRSWTHTMQKSGDYQLGMAWVQVDSGDDVALEVFKNGTERVKALYAPAGEVTRFETRIEGLFSGDTITVKITPNGGRYRAGYQIACSTPFFEGLPTFNVHDAAYGAVGDGVTDDFAAIQAAVAAAKAAGGGIVEFDGSKIYRAVGLNDLTVESLIDLENAANIKIEGNGATVVLHPPDRFTMVRDAENIQIDGFTIDYDPIPYYQGTITNIDVANLTIDIDVPARYAEPAVGIVLDPGSGDGTGRGPFFGRSFIPDAAGARSGRGQNIYVESTTRIGGDPRKIRIQVPETANGASMLPRLQDAFDNNATEFVVPDIDYGHRNGSSQIYRSSRVKLSHLQYYNMAHFWLTITQNDGPVTLSNVDLEVSDPATELLASWRDGMHIKNGRWGVLIEEGDWDGAAMYDDTFAIYSRRQVVVSTAVDEVTLTPGFGLPETWLWQPGDWASFWSSDQSILRGMGRVVRLSGEDSPQYSVKFESLPDGILPDDVVLHEESLNRGTLIRNNRTSDVGTESSTTRLRGTDMRFENNTFEDFDFRLEWSDGLATPRARDVVVQNCYFRSVNGSFVLSRALGVLFKDCQIDGLSLQLNSGASDVYFDNVAWSNMTGDILSLTEGSSAWVFGNSTRNGSSTGLANHVSVDGGSSIAYTSPSGYSPLPPLLSAGFAPPVAPLLEAVAGEGRVALDWSGIVGAEKYTVYRATAANGPFLPLVQTQASAHVDIGLAPGQTFFYVVTATDSSGNESSFGNLIAAQPTGRILSPQADAYVHGGSFANVNYGSSVTLRCKTDANPDFTRESYLRFDLSLLTGSVGSAILRLKAFSAPATGDVLTAYAVSDDSWEESTLTWNNKPTPDTALASVAAPNAGEWIELDVTSRVRTELAGDQSFSTVLISSGSGLVTYHSREATSAEDHPELAVTMLSSLAPSAPTGLSVVADGVSNVFLDWDDQSSAGVGFYAIHRSTFQGGPYTLLMHTDTNTFIDKEADPSQINYYVVSAIDAGGDASGFSLEASTADTTPLLLAELNPADDDHDVAGAAHLVATFNREVQPGSGRVTLVNLTDGVSDDISIIDETQITLSGSTLTIHPIAPLLASSDYAVRIDSGAIDGEFGPSFAGVSDDATWNFSTGSPRESFLYFDETRLSGGLSSSESGWLGGWEALSGGGVRVCNRRIDQNGAAGSTREMSSRLSLQGPDDFYLSFFARADADGAFRVELAQTSPGPFVRWALGRNADGSITIQGGTVTATSPAGVFAAGKEYLVVSKFETNGDIAYVTLIDPVDPGDYRNEPLIWDISVDGNTGVTLDRINIRVSSGSVQLDDLAVSPFYHEVIGGMLSEVPQLLTPVNGASSPYAFPNFSWTEHREQFREMDAPTNYEIQIASDEAFSSLIDQDIVGLPRYVHEHPLPTGVYFWRVRSITDGGRVSDWNATGFFEISAYDETVTVDYDSAASDHTAEVLVAVGQTASFAAQGKSVKVVFPPGDYFFGDESVGTLIHLPGVRDLAVQGHGANLHFVSHRQSLMSSEDSVNVSLSGLRVHYATGALRIQGTVTAVEPATSTVTLAIEPGYLDFNTGTIRPQNIFLLLDPEIDGRQKTGSVSFYRAAPAGAYSKNPDGTWRVRLDRDSTPEWEVGDRFVYLFRAGSPVLTRFNNSHAVTLYGLALGGWGNMMIHSLEGSLVNVLHLDTFYQENKWMVGNADGVHIRGHSVGPWIESTRIQGIGDDGIALYARPASMSSAKPGGAPNAAVFVDSFFNLEAGDEVAFFEPLIGTILLETRVSSVEKLNEGGWLVYFDAILPDGMNFIGDLVNITQVWNRSKSCGDFMIRNGRMIHNRRYATVFRSQRGIIENMEYRGASSNSIIFSNGTVWPNGLYASEIIIRNNLIEDSGFVAGDAPPIAFNFNGHLTGAQGIGPRNLLIENNSFVDCGTPEIAMNNTRNAVVRNNRSFDGVSFTEAVLVASNSEQIFFEPIRFLRSVSPTGRAFPSVDLVATFSEAMRIGAGNITVSNLTNGTSTLIPIEDSAQVSLSGTVLTVNLPTDLPVDAEISVLIDPGALETLGGVLFAGIESTATWTFRVRDAESAIVENGDFSENAEDFTAWPGYVGGENPPEIFWWTLGETGNGGIGDSRKARDDNPFGPTNRGDTVFYAFLQRGGSQLTQTLSGRLAPNTNYRISYVAASRSGNTAALGRVTVGDESSDWYDSGARQWSASAFESVSAEFTTGATFAGSPTITLRNVSPPNDLTVNYGRIEIVKLVTYANWVQSHNLTGMDAELGADPDGDGMNNLVEYALGGNPKLGDAASVRPLHAVSTDDFFYFSHNERTDDPSLSYTVQFSSDLGVGNWTTEGVEKVGESTPENGFKTVTSRVSMDTADTAGFLRLRIESTN